MLVSSMLRGLEIITARDPARLKHLFYIHIVGEEEKAGASLYLDAPKTPGITVLRKHAWFVAVHQTVQDIMQNLQSCRAEDLIFVDRGDLEPPKLVMGHDIDIFFEHEKVIFNLHLKR